MKDSSKSLLISIIEKLLRLTGGLFTAILLTRILVSSDVKIWTETVALTTFFISFLEFGQREKIVFEYTYKSQYNPLIYTRIIGIIFLIIFGVISENFWIYIFPALSLLVYHYSIGRQISEYYGYTQYIRKETIIRLTFTLFKLTWVVYGSNSILLGFIILQSFENIMAWLSYRKLFTNTEKVISHLRISNLYQKASLLFVSIFMLLWIKLDKLLIFRWQLNEASLDYISSLRLVESSFPLIMVFINTKFKELKLKETRFYISVILLVVLIGIDSVVGLSSLLIERLYDKTGVVGNYSTSQLLLIPIFLIYEYLKRYFILADAINPLLIFSIIACISLVTFNEVEYFSLYRTMALTTGLVYLLCVRRFYYSH